jgi:hypothetical protein
VLCRGLRWLPQASLIKHAFEALCINEFKGLTFELDDKGGGMKTGTCGWKGMHCFVVCDRLVGMD